MAGQSPALPERRIPWRVACAQIWGWDPITWTPTVQLEHVSDTATRTASLSDLGRQTETLTFDVAAPLTLDLLEGDWLAVLWSVANPSNSTSYTAGVYRVEQAPSMDRDASGILYHVQALDWLGYIARSELSASGWYDTDLIPVGTPPYQLVNWLTDYLADQLIAATITWEQWTDFNPFPIAVPDTGHFTQVTTPGSPVHVSDLLAWWFPRTGGYTLAYLPGGHLSISSKIPTASGIYLTDDTTVLGTVPLPWETAQHTYQHADVLTVEYWLNNTDGANIYFRSAQGVTSHDLGLTTIERIVDVGVAVTLSGFVDGSDYVLWRLHQHLGAADTLAVTCDSAFPPPPLGRLIAVHLLPSAGSTQAVAGHYRVVGWTQPLGVGQASATLQWWSAL